MKVYIHEKLEVKQNETNKNLVLDQDIMGSTVPRKRNYLQTESLSGSCENQMC
jgi:hypothetical protein